MKTHFFHRSLIVKSQQNRTELATRPAVGVAAAVPNPWLAMLPPPEVKLPPEGAAGEEPKPAPGLAVPPKGDAVVAPPPKMDAVEAADPPKRLPPVVAPPPDTLLPPRSGH